LGLPYTHNFCQIGLDVKSKDTDDATEQTEVVEVVDEDQEISDELERLKTEAAARAKRERRKANEIKTRTIQRMQLQMTAPLDIGLEQHDAALDFGQDDTFDLGATERGMNNRSRVKFLEDDANMSVDDSESENEGMSEDDEVLDEDEEKAKKLAALENTLDDLYGAYQEHLKSRDAKYKVKQSRERNGAREEWGGIAGKDSDEGSGSEEEEEGGWNVMQKAKARGDASSSDEDSDSDEELPTGKKRPLASKSKAIEATNKRRKLISPLEKKDVPSSGASRLWFSQGVFAGMDDLNDVGDDGMDVDENAQQEAESVMDDEENHAEVSLLPVVGPAKLITFAVTV